MTLLSQNIMFHQVCLSVSRRVVAGTTRRALSSYATESAGQFVQGFPLKNEEDSSGNKISPWHDIDLFVNKEQRIVNFVNEIPRGAVEKMEVATKEEFNPIKQDTKKGKLRLYPFQSLVNYGCLPQTWEDPSHKDESTGMLGDNDPVDVVEVGSVVHASGEVYPVKLLGILGMIDEGEMDWKVIGIDVNDPLAGSINSVQDLEQHMPGKVDAVVKWFKYYKMPDGKPENVFAFDDKAQDVDFTMNIIDTCHKAWLNTSAVTGQKLWKP